MKKIFLSLGIILFFTVYADAQTINSVFTSIPDDILLGLEAEEKSALLDDSQDSVSIETENEIYTNIRRIGFSSDFISLQTSDSAFLQIKLLPLVNDSKIVCVINTVCGKACDSHVKFFTPDWKPITSLDLFPKINANWFLKSGIESEDYKNAVRSLDMIFVKLNLSSENNNITANLNIKSYLNEVAYKNLEPYLKGETKILSWDKSRFK